MKRLLVIGAALAAVGGAAAQGKGYAPQDHSTAGLMDKATAQGIWKEALPEARLAKLYPPVKWGFLSQVEGGLVGGQTCVVTARVALLPRTSPTRRLVWEPAKMATTFDSRPGSDAAQCKALAAEKLKEAVGALVASLVKT